MQQSEDNQQRQGEQGSKHTPGEWVLVRTEYPRGWNVEARDGTYTVAIVRDGNDSPQNEANARLIAAAPELLEARQTRAAVAELIDSMPALIEIAACRAPVSLGAIRRAEAALARAQGERS